MANKDKSIEHLIIQKQTELAALMAEEELLERRLEKELSAELIHSAKTNLKSFFMQAWEYIEPGKPYMDNWHIDALCDHLEALYKNEIQNLVVEISPRSSKSSICNVVFPVWCWINSPEMKFITAAAIDKLAIRDAVRSRRLIQTGWFQKNFAIPSELEFASDVNQKSRYENTKLGYRIATSVAGQGIGEGYDVLIVDDPHKPSEINSKTAREAVIEWYTGTLSTRKNSPDSKKLIIHQRLHQGDLIGWIKENELDVFDVLTIPMRFDPERKFYTSIGWEDPRKEKGEIFWKERWPEYELKNLEKNLGMYGTAAQLQQSPVPREGGVIKKDWIKYYQTPFNKFQYNQFELLIGSWDLAFTETGDSYSVGTVWGKRGSSRYLLAQYRGKLDVIEQLQGIRAMKKDFPSIRAILVERKANGDAVLRMLQKEVSGLIAISPQEIGGGDKEVRLAACSIDFEAGNVFFPDPTFAPWVKDTIIELVNFPKADNDDIVDSISQALNWLATKGGSSSVGVSANVEDTIPTEISKDYDWQNRRSEDSVAKQSITSFVSTSVSKLKNMFS